MKWVKVVGLTSENIHSSNPPTVYNNNPDTLDRYAALPSLLGPPALPTKRLFAQGTAKPRAARTRATAAPTRTSPRSRTPTRTSEAPTRTCGRRRPGRCWCCGRRGPGEVRAPGAPRRRTGSPRTGFGATQRRPSRRSTCCERPLPPSFPCKFLYSLGNKRKGCVSYLVCVCYPGSVFDFFIRIDSTAEVSLGAC